jgi:hypothetical protein
MANRRYIDFPIASTSGDTDIILIWQDGANKQTTKATFLSGLPENLDELNDVAISGLTNGQILRYDSVTGKWENTDQGNLDLNDLNDVSIVSPSNGQVLVYNSSTSKWENSSGGYVPYTGAVTTVDLGAQQLKAGHTTLTTNGSTETLTINHTSGSGKAINVTKGGAGEGLYVNKTSGSGNAATIVGTLEATTLVKTGGTSSQFLKADGSVDSTSYGTGTVTSVGLSSATSGVTIGSSPVTTSGTITLAIATASGSQNGLLSSTDWTTFNGKQNALTNPVTGTGTTNYLPKFTGTSMIGNSIIFDNGSNIGIRTASPISAGTYYTTLELKGATGGSGNEGGYYLTTDADGTTIGQLGVDGNFVYVGSRSNTDAVITSNNTERIRAFAGGNVHIGPTGATDNGARLQVSGTATVSGSININNSAASNYDLNIYNTIPRIHLQNPSSGTSTTDGFHIYQSGLDSYIINKEASDLYLGSNNGINLTIASTGAATFSSSVAAAAGTFSGILQVRSTASTPSIWSGSFGGAISILGDNATSNRYIDLSIVDSTGALATQGIRLLNNGNVGIGTTSPSAKFEVLGLSTFAPSATLTAGDLLVDTNNKTVYLGRLSNITGDNTRVIMRSRTGTIGFSYNPSDSITFFNDGNVLIGTTTDNGARLQVSGAATFSSSVTSGDILYVGAGGGGGGYWTWGGSDSYILAPTGKNLHLYSGDVGTNGLKIATTGAATFSSSVTANNTITLIGPNATNNTENAASILFDANSNLMGKIVGFRGVDGNDGNLRFYTGNSTTLSLTLASTGAATFSNFNGAAVYGVTINSNNNTGTQYMMSFDRIGVQAGYIASTSSTTAGIFNSSDYRLKEDLQSFSGIGKLMSMKFYDFKWKSEEGFRDYGVIAHELQEVLPMAVIGEKDGEVNQGVDYSKLIPIMAKAIQELKAELDELKSKN